MTVGEPIGATAGDSDGFSIAPLSSTGAIRKGVAMVAVDTGGENTIVIDVGPLRIMKAVRTA